MPMADATTPDRDHLAERPAYPRSFPDGCISGRILCDGGADRQSTVRASIGSGRRRARRPAGGRSRRRRPSAPARPPEAVGGPVVGGGDAVVAPEGLGELRRLAVADALGDLAHGERAASRASRPRGPCGRGSGGRGTSCCPISAYARWSWRREEATRRAMSSSERSRGVLLLDDARRHPRRGWCGGGWWRVAEWTRQGYAALRERDARYALGEAGALALETLAPSGRAPESAVALSAAIVAMTTQRGRNAGA